MRKLLPRFTLCLVISLLIWLSFFQEASAQVTLRLTGPPLPTVSPTAPTPTDPPPTPTPTTTPTPTVPAGTWVEDSEVTFVGKVASRSAMFLDWTFRDYSWSYVALGQRNPLVSFWVTVRNIVYAFFVLAVLIAAFVLIVTRGTNITVKKFISWFITAVLLVTFSFALLQFVYQIADVVQGFFLKNPSGEVISSKDLLSVEFDYRYFKGYRLSGSSFDEAAMVSLLLTKLTAFTYYVMAGILLLRKVILWVFIIVSPIFPFLLFSPSIRSSARVWIYEFFRWLLYGPIFAVLLSGLVSLWMNRIPLRFDFSSVGATDTIAYPTAISILLGGPGQNVSLTNSLNTPDTFALYIVSLIMLWAVIFLPLVLLGIFLDYARTVPIQEYFLAGPLMNTTSAFIKKNLPFLNISKTAESVGEQRYERT